MSRLEKVPCPGCKGLFPDVDGERFRYGTSSPGCWQAFTILLGHEQSNLNPIFNRLVVDAYAVQHPQNLPLQKELGIEDRLITASIQSIPVHLLALYCALENKIPYASISLIMSKFLSFHTSFVPFEQPESLGNVTVEDFSENFNQLEYEAFAQSWANEAWQSWKSYHTLIKDWHMQLMK